MGIKVSHVDIDKPHSGILESSFAGSRKVAIARANANDEIGLLSNAIGGQGSGHADGAET